MVHLPDCPLDSLLHCQEQKVKEWSRDWVMLKPVFTELVEYHNICFYINSDVLEEAETRQKRDLGPQRAKLISKK